MESENGKTKETKNEHDKENKKSILEDSAETHDSFDDSNTDNGAIKHDTADTAEVEEAEPEEELSEVDKLKKELEEKEKKIIDLNDKILRTHAKLKNAQRQSKKDADLRIFESKKRLLKNLLFVRDNIDRALNVDWPENTENHKKGIQLIGGSVNDLFDLTGVSEIQAQGKMYDIVKHEAVGSVPYNGPENRVIDVIEKGYLLDGKVLRPTKVLISIKPVKEEKKKEKDETDLKQQSEKQESDVLDKEEIKNND